MSRQPISPRGLAANRVNAARSTGPRTPEGKARSAQNARKHGFAAANFSVIHHEDAEFVENLKADLVSLYQPAHSQELFAIERIALAQLALLRCAALEAGFFTACLNTSMNSDGRACYVHSEDVTRDPGVAEAQVRSYCLADGFQRLNAKSNAWTLFLRYQAQTERLYRRAVEEFERLRSLREELPNEPAAAPEPEETEPACSPQTNPSPSAPSPAEAPSASSPVTSNGKSPRTPPAAFSRHHNRAGLRHAVGRLRAGSKTAQPPY
jgi:hypothetical protein